MAFSGALVYKGSALTAQNFTAAATLQTFDTEAYDTDGWHSTVSNTGRLTVPSGVTYAEFAANITIDNFTAGNGWTIEIRKNGASLPAVAWNIGSTNHTSVKFTVWTGPVAVSAGDYFEAFVTCSVDTSVDVAAGSWFAGWKAPAAPGSFSGCVAQVVSDISGANYTTATAIPFDAELYDVGAWHDTASNNTRLTVPSGVTYVQLIASVDPSAFTANQWFETSIRKGGSAMTPPIVVNHAAGTSTVTRRMIMTPPLPVSAGDYFELFVQTQSDTSITLLSSRLWFSIRKVA